MSHSFLIIVASTRSLLRWGRQHIYAWLILAPVVLGITYFTAMRLAENVPDWEISSRLAITLASLFTLSLIGLSLSRASAEIYHPRRPEAYFDSLPVSAASHLHAALATRVARTAVVAAAAIVVRGAFGETGRLTFSDLPTLLCFTALTAGSETFGALNWIHWGHTKNWRVAVGALLLLVVNGSLDGLLLTILFLRTSFSSGNTFLVWVFCVVWIPIIYCLAYLLHGRWRRSDLEYARRLQTATRPTLRIEQALERRLAPAVAAQFARDVRLTIRAFSSAVYVVFGIAGLLCLMLVAALTVDWAPMVLRTTPFLDLTWLPQIVAIKVACVLSLVSLASLLPVLIAYELPHMWLERAAGTTGLDLLRAKISYARFLTSPAPLVIWCTGMLTGSVPVIYALPLLAECLWLWWLVSSLSGALSFEMPTRPDLAIIVNGTIGLALGLVSAFLWPVGLIVYPQAMQALADRGRQRARYYLITEAE